MARASRTDVEDLLSAAIRQKVPKVGALRVNFDRRLNHLFKVSRAPGGIRVDFSVSPAERKKFIDTLNRCAKAVYELRFTTTHATSIAGDERVSTCKAIVPIDSTPQAWSFDRILLITGAPASLILKLWEET